MAATLVEMCNGINTLYCAELMNGLYSAENEVSIVCAKCARAKIPLERIWHGQILYDWGSYSNFSKDL